MHALLERMWTRIGYRITLADVLESDEICAETEIPGLYWIRNPYLRTSSSSRIVLPDPFASAYTIVYHASDFSDSVHGGYEVYGIHLGQVDVLTFLTFDDRIIKGSFVDCRKNSPTLHTKVELEFKGSPHRSLVIERGIAHIFDNLAEMATLNQPRLYFDFANPDFDPGIDVLNVPRDTEPEDFPVVRVNRWRAPRWMTRLALKYQRVQLKKGVAADHPFRFRVGKYKITLRVQRSAGLLAPYFGGDVDNDCS